LEHLHFQEMAGYPVRGQGRSVNAFGVLTINGGAAAAAIWQDFDRAGRPAPMEETICEGDEKACLIGLIECAYLVRVAGSCSFIPPAGAPDAPYAVPIAFDGQIVRRFPVSKTESPFAKALRFPIAGTTEFDVKGLPGGYPPPVFLLHCFLLKNDDRIEL
jgi:hypothetical protein